MKLFAMRRVLFVLLFEALVASTAMAQAATAPAPRRETWFAEVGLGVSARVEDAYTRRLEDFRFETPAFDTLGGFESMASAQSLGYMLHPNVGVLFRHESLESRSFVRHLTANQEDSYDWETRGFSLGARARKPLHKEWFALYAQGNIGFAMARSSYRNHGQSIQHEKDFGLLLGVRAGIHINFFKYGGLFMEAGYNHAPVLENDFGETHNDGGASWLMGLRVRGLRGE